jgi:hypothetical protein
MNRAESLPIAEGRSRSLPARRAVAAAALLGVMAAAVAIGAIGPAASSVLATQTAADGSGLGFMMVLGCVACLAGFLMGAGTTIAGLAIFLAAHPELAILCASTCVAAVL